MGTLTMLALAFVCASYILRRWPLLLHSSKQPHLRWSRVRSIAHRGGREATPENTLSGFRRCCEGKLVDAVELDVWLTADGEVAVFHDGTFQRTVGTDGHVNDVRSDALPTILQRGSDGFRQGEGVATIPAAERKIPLLGQVFALLALHPSISVMVEFKGPEPELRRKVLALLQQHGILHRAACFSLDKEINANLRAMPEFFICSDVPKVVAVLVVYYCGLIGFLPTSFFDPIFGITAAVVENGNLGFLHRIPVVRSLPLKAQWAIAHQVGNITNAPKLFDHLRQRNIVTWCLGVNTPEKLARACEMVRFVPKKVQLSFVVTLNNILSTAVMTPWSRFVDGSGGRRGVDRLTGMDSERSCPRWRPTTASFALTQTRSHERAYPSRSKVGVAHVLLHRRVPPECLLILQPLPVRTRCMS